RSGPGLGEEAAGHWDCRFVPGADGENAGNENLEDGIVSLGCEFKKGRLGIGGDGPANAADRFLDIKDLLVVRQYGRRFFPGRSMLFSCHDYSRSGDFEVSDR